MSTSYAWPSACRYCRASVASKHGLIANSGSLCANPTHRAAACRDAICLARFIGGHAPQHVAEHPVADRPLLKRIDVDRHGVLHTVDVAGSVNSSARKNPFTGSLKKPTKSARITSSRGDGGSGPEMNLGCSAHLTSAARSTVGSN